MGRDFAFCALFLILVTALSFGLLRQEYLHVRDTSGRLLLMAPLPAGQEFAIRFIHSVAKSPVEDWFSAQEGHVALKRTVYQDFGAGLPHEAGEGQKMFFKDGQVIITGFALRLPALQVRVGRVAQHQLLLPAGLKAYRTVPLDSLAVPGAALVFSVHSQTFAEALGQQWRVCSRM